MRSSIKLESLPSDHTLRGRHIGLVSLLTTILGVPRPVLSVSRTNLYDILRFLTPILLRYSKCVSKYKEQYLWNIDLMFGEYNPKGNHN